MIKIHSTLPFNKKKFKCDLIYFWHFYGVLKIQRFYHYALMQTHVLTCAILVVYLAIK